jgi:hypothetical protein
MIATTMQYLHKRRSAAELSFDVLDSADARYERQPCGSTVVGVVQRHDTFAKVQKMPSHWFKPRFPWSSCDVLCVEVSSQHFPEIGPTQHRSSSQMVLGESFRASLGDGESGSRLQVLYTIYKTVYKLFSRSSKVVVTIPAGGFVYKIQ